MDKIPSIGSVNSTETPGKKKFDRKKLITAYILFSADVSGSFTFSEMMLTMMIAMTMIMMTTMMTMMMSVTMMFTAYIIFSADVSESLLLFFLLSNMILLMFFMGIAGPEDHDGREPWGQVW